VSARLREAALTNTAAGVRKPAYDRGSMTCGVVHLGLGAFHRAHQAPVFDRLLSAGHAGCGVTAVSIRSGRMRAALTPQDGLFTVLEREGRRRTASVCGAVRRVLVLGEDPAGVAAAIADPQVRLVTLTLTEKAYDASTEGTVWPVIALALAARRAAEAPLTIASCDNLVGAGLRTRASVLRAVGDPALADWIGEACAFPNAMVDRITPAPTEADLGEVEALLGVRDEAAVVTEPFWQWVIEDRFAGEAPPLAEAGVEVVRDVAPFERAKLRLLNAAHSAMAYLGLLAGFSFIHEAVAWAPMRKVVERLWDEAAPTLTSAPGLDVPAYRTALLRRFENPSLAHRLDQIAEDGSRKLPQRLLGPLGERARLGAPSPAMTLALAAWIRCLCGHDDQGRPIRIVDPNLTTLRQALAGGADPLDAIVSAGMLEGVPAPDVRTALADTLTRLAAKGVREALFEGAD
jgi:fructuronate reductase